MIKLRKGKPPFVPVRLDGGAVVRVRAATSKDVEVAGARAQQDIMGMVAGSASAGVLAEVLGEGFDIAAAGDLNRSMAAISLLTEVYLVLAVQDGWKGIATEDGVVIDRPDAASVALLLSDSGYRNKIMAVVNSRIHEVEAEKNGSTASPNGGAGTPDGAPAAGATANLALPADTSLETTASGSAALSSNTRH